MIQQVNKSELRRHIQTIQDFGPHPTGSEALELVGEYIYSELDSTNLPVEYIDWSNEKYSGKNIFACSCISLSEIAVVRLFVY